MIEIWIGAGLTGAAVAGAWLRLRQTGALCRWRWIDHVWKKGERRMGESGREYVTHRCVLCGRTRIDFLPQVARGHTRPVSTPAPDGASRSGVLYLEGVNIP